MRCSFRRGVALSLAALGLSLSQPSWADLGYSGSSTSSAGDAISADVNFHFASDVLTITITNDGESKAQADVLTNLGITTNPSPGIALPSVDGTIALTAGSSLVSGTTVDTTHTLGQEWAYLTGGAASSGFGVGSGSGNLCGSTTCNGVALDGSAFGLVGTQTTVADLQGATTNGLKPANTYVKDSVTITITLASTSTFNLGDITAVNFQYGTSPGEGSIVLTTCQSGSNCVGGHSTGGAAAVASRNRPV